MKGPVLFLGVFWVGITCVATDAFAQSGDPEGTSPATHRV